MTNKTSNPPVTLDNQLCYSIYTAGIAVQRLYKPLLDELGLTYPQYLVLNVLWVQDGQSVGAIAEKLALESSTLTPLLKRLEASGLVQRMRNKDNERQVVVSLTDAGRALQGKGGCLGDALLEATGATPARLGEINKDVREFRNRIYGRLDGWEPPV